VSVSVLVILPRSPQGTCFRFGPEAIEFSREDPISISHNLLPCKQQRNLSNRSIPTHRVGPYARFVALPPRFLKDFSGIADEHDHTRRLWDSPSR
jgi:hypothetical protein